MKLTSFVAALLLPLATISAVAKTVPPAATPAPSAVPTPVLASPASGASLVQPVALAWNPVAASGGPIGSYTWQVGTTSAFTTIIAAGFTDVDNDATIPTPTASKVSGLPNGTYFWRVKATALVGGATFSADSPWSATRTFTVTGLGAAPPTPSFITPVGTAQYHPVEFFDIKWTPVTGAQYYILEVDDEPTFSYPLNLMTETMSFGTQVHAGWGNALTAYYRIRAVSADNVRGLPSATLTVHVTDAAPVPAPPSQVSPAPGATVSLPFKFDWTDTPNPQIPGYDIDTDTSPTFSSPLSTLFIQNISRSDYVLTPDNPGENILPVLPPGNYFWRVRAQHGDTLGPWSAGRAFTVVAAPPTPPDARLFFIITEPNTTEGGNPVQARVTLDAPAPAGGAVVTIGNDTPQVEAPATVTVPAGKTDAILTPITTPPVPGTVVGNIRATYGNAWQQSSLGMVPMVAGTGLSVEKVVGGTSFTGVVTLVGPAPAGGATIKLISGDTSLVRPPATVFVPAGSFDAAFTVTTGAVSVPTRVTIDTGSDRDGARGVQQWVVVTPPGSSPPAPSLASLVLDTPVVVGGATASATVRLTSPAPPGGVVVTLGAPTAGGPNIAPANGVTVPAGSLAASFTMTTPQVDAPQWVVVQAHYGTFGGTLSRVLEIDPGATPGPATLLTLIANAPTVIGGQTLRGSAALIAQAPAGDAVVTLSSDNPAVLQVPAAVTIAAGNSANSFTVTSSPVLVATSAHIIASAGGVTRSWFVNVTPDPNAPPLLKSVSIAPASVAGGTSATGTILLSAPAPAGGLPGVTLATSNPGIATVPGSVNVPAGQTSVTFPVTTFAVSATTTATITAFYDAAPTATITVTKGTTAPPPPPPTGALPAPSLLSPAADARVAPGQSITFDWSDVSGAAGYTLQVSGQSTFTAFILNQTVTASQLSSSTLPTQTMWFRVRANDPSGNPGAWSAARRFEVKN